MEFDNSFEVPLPVGDAWALLMDIRRIAPCMPGAALTEVVDERTYKGRIGVRLGPVALTFAGTVKFEEIDDARHTARVAAQGSDAKGRGGANAVASFRLEPAGGGAKVLVHTNLTLSGAVAQYGRGVGIIQMTAAQIITQFANNLKAQLAKESAPAAAAQAEAQPLSAASASPAQAPQPGAPPAPFPGSAGVAPPPHSSPPLAEKGREGAPGGTPALPAGDGAAEVKPISGFALMAKVLWRFVRRLFGRE
ncbi:MAG TPA: SRPBCC family protein [Xanthobacteraceae bacterium]|jgi:carbon monoxide dehydrogenase subunit G|nr:SRPBCC family protein [Xanthobacteraceae bacterium]